MYKSRLHKFEFKRKEMPDVFLSSQYGMYTYSDLDRFTAFIKDLIEDRIGSLEGPVAFLSESSDMQVLELRPAGTSASHLFPLILKLTMISLKNILKL